MCEGIADNRGYHGELSDGYLRQLLSVSHSGPSGHSRPSSTVLPFELRREIGPKLTAVTLSPGADEDAFQGLKVCREIFANEGAQACRNLALTYKEILAGTPVIRSEDEPPGYGDTIEWTAFYVFYSEGSSVGIGGLYRYPMRSGEAWLGRFGVVESKRSSGLAQQLIDLHAADAWLLGATRLLAFTESENNVALRFYEKYGFRLTGETYPYEGKDNPILEIALR